jgi:hypothetical protein
MTRTNPTWKALAWGLIALAGLAHQACATVPRPSAGGPADVEAPSGEAAIVTRALDEDPPLPGSDVNGWSGLHTPVAADPHAAHRHGGHHGH